MATGEVGVLTVNAVPTVAAVCKKSSAIATTLLQRMVVLVVLVTVRWCEHVICNVVQVGQAGVAGDCVRYHATVVFVSASETVRKNTVPDLNHQSVYATFTVA